MLKPHVLALISCFTAASVRAAIQSTDAAALIFDPSNGVDSSEKRNLREKFPYVTDEERAGVTMFQLQDLMHRFPSAFNVARLQQLVHDPLATFDVEFSNVEESLQVIVEIVPPVSLRPGEHFWMALGGAYFKENPMRLSGGILLDSPDGMEEATLATILEKNNLNPATGILKLRLLNLACAGRGIPIGYLRSMVLGSEIMARARKERDEGLSFTKITFEGVNVLPFERIN
ncbi:hypothetical protein PsorP6_007788 [Peronosclerospora sorghi]|uniref:Uncharacterized protein n=1 Tax=Peronosclerospora sorghi TaxID=230839 RepID=A0ACC0WAR6_9STRA|nr:hypothetical protein PsorP6_007788 [Peronosclerospora sorghi]